MCVKGCSVGFKGRLGKRREVVSPGRKLRFSSLGLGAGVAVVVMALVGGCSSASTEGEPAGAAPVTAQPVSPVEPTPSNVEPPRRPQEDFCDQVDYSAGSTVFGVASRRPFGRTMASEDDHHRCFERFEDGYASVDIQIHESAAAATEAFDVVAIFVTVAPYPGADELSADQLQFRHMDDRTLVELRVENLFVEVSLSPGFGRNNDPGPDANEVSAATAALAKSVLEVLSEDE